MKRLPLKPRPRVTRVRVRVSVGDKVQRVCGAPRNSSASVSAGSPHPHAAFTPGLALPRALPSEGTRPILALSWTLLIVGQRIPLQRASLAAKTDAAGTYPGRSAATPRTLPRLPPPGRDTPPLLSRLPRDVAAARGTLPAGLGLGLWTHRLREARLGSGGRRGYVRRRVRTARAGGSRLAKSARGTGSVAHPPGVRVSQRETEGASYRGAVGGGVRHDTLPAPTPPHPRRDADSHSLLRDLDTKTACQLQTQVFPKPRGSTRLHPVTEGPWTLDTPGNSGFPPQPGCLPLHGPGRSPLG